MPHLRESQEQFAGMIAGGDKAALCAQITESDIPCVDRLAVHLNNVYYGLTEAMADTFPVIKRLVGDRFFRFASRRFIETHPPKTPVLAAYGSNFGEFLKDFEPAASLPYLCDIAKLEFAWLEAYHERDARPLSVNDLKSIPDERYAGLRLQLHPSRRFIRSDYPVARIWEINRRDDVVEGTLDLSSGPDHAVVIRPRMKVEIRTMNSAAFEFLGRLDAGLTLTEALDAALQVDDKFDLRSALQQLISGGTFVGFSFDEMV